MPKIHLFCNSRGKEDNSSENLEVMTQSEHIREHLRRGGGRLAQIV